MILFKCHVILFKLSLTVCLVTNGFVNFASGKGSFMARLSGGDDVPRVNTSATGMAKFQLKIPEQSLNYRLNVTNLTGITGAHIHSGKLGQIGPIVATLFNQNMTIPPTSKMNGLLAKGVIKSGDLQGPLKGSSVAELLSLISRGAYVNVHTQQHQSGEIRGQIH